MDVGPIITTSYIIDTDKLFIKERVVKIVCDTEGTEIYYTVDGTEPDKNSRLYKEPYTVKRTTTINMKAYKDGQKSLFGSVDIKKTG